MFGRCPRAMQQATDEPIDRCWTAAQAFYAPGRLGLIEPPAKVATPEWVFVYGGSCECTELLR